MRQGITIAVILVSLGLLAGCATPQARSTRGPAYGQEELFRQKLAESKPVTEWGYAVEAVKFSHDFRRANVVFTSSRGTSAHREAVLVYDSERGYFGRIYNHDLAHSSPLTIGEVRAMTADISVNLATK